MLRNREKGFTTTRSKVVVPTEIGRRGVLVGGVGLVSLALLGEITAGPATAETLPSPIRAAPTQPRMINTFSADFGTVFSSSVGSVVQLSCDHKVETGARCEVTYDARLYEVSTPMIITPRHVKSAEAQTTVEGNLGQATFAVDSAFGGEDGDLAVLVPLIPRELYPAENIGRIATPVMRVVTTDGSATHVELGMSDEEAVAVPWGVELSGSWVEIPVREGRAARTYRLPALVRLRSVGPGPIPAGTVVAVTLDRSVASGCVVTDVVLDNEPIANTGFTTSSSVDGDELRTRVRLPESIESGRILEMTLATTTASAPQLDGIVFARVYSQGVIAADRPERVTGRTTLIDVTNSGAADSVGAASGRG